MNEVLTEEMIKAVSVLGELIKADPRHGAIINAMDEYERSEELMGLISEYNLQQNVIAEKIGEDKEARDVVQKRINDLYDKIAAHPVYVKYLEAKAAFDELSNKVYEELQYVITGSRPCSHDCSSCGGGCSH